MTDTTAVKITPAMRRSLQVLADHGPDVTAHQAARLLYPENPAWRRTGQRHDGKSGAAGATLWLTAAKGMHRLAGARLASTDYNDQSQPSWTITEAGRKALAS